MKSSPYARAALSQESTKPLEMKDEAIEDYTTEHSSPEPPLLAELSRETAQKALAPRMLSGHYQGRLLALLSKMLRPETILEIGTYTGY